MASSSAGRPWVSLTEAALDLVAALGLVAGDEVLGVAGEQVAVVGAGRWRREGRRRRRTRFSPFLPAGRFAMDAAKVLSFFQ